MTESMRPEDLYPTARALFQTPSAEEGRGKSGLRWLAVLAAVGTAIVVGRWALDSLDRNL